MSSSNLNSYLRVEANNFQGWNLIDIDDEVFNYNGYNGDNVEEGSDRDDVEEQVEMNLQRELLLSFGEQLDMESLMRVVEDGAGGEYFPLRNLEEHEQENDIGSGDDARLKQLGYKRELSRSLSAIANFSVTFSIISILTGLTTLYNTGLTYGGPLTMIWGWPVVGLFTMTVGLSMAEICSAYPTSGGLYFWSAKLCGNRWGPLASWFTGWFNIVGQWAVTASIDFSLAQMIQVIILLSTGGKNGGGYEASKYVVIGLYGGILLLHALMNSLPISVLSFFGQLAAAWNLVGVTVLMILIPTVTTERASAKFVFTHFNTDNGDGIGNKAYIFFLGLLMSQYTFTGYDASAHMTEETRNADKNGPKGIISSIGISIIFGWGYLLGITFAVTDIPYLLSEDNDSGGYAIAEIFYMAFKNRYGSGVGGIVCLGVVAVGIFFCGMSSVTSNSRMAYAFSRDGAMPFSSLWHKVNKQEVPINAVWFSAFISFCMALTYLGSEVAFQAMVSIATIGLYIAYAFPIFFRVTLARKSFIPGPFNLGSYGILVGWISVLWVATISVLFSLPVAYPITSETLNYTPVAVCGLLVLTVSSWILSARHWFKDHRVILTEVVGVAVGFGGFQKRQQRIFHFKACRVDEVECKNLVSDGWAETGVCSDMRGVVSKDLLIGRVSFRFVSFSKRVLDNGSW
ncbi:hypothetical protein LWI28_010616 [Acer negundo]|uniref:Amino-acid permease BAT1 homolog n=1 Tax=Acer negundo TaxID=4023 RepID=A0AAD5IM23_ACENE|nr:hypothetical protein LWI28_010616 [Acer negundo]